MQKIISASSLSVDNNLIFAFGGIEVQKQMLVDEGVCVDENFVVDMTKYKWDTEDSYEKGI